MLDTSQELIDIVDIDNKLTGVTKLRNIVHTEMKDWHRATGIWIVNGKKQFLCHKRARMKDSYPGVWTTTFGGHLKSGQNYDDNAIEELQEELGIFADQDHLIKLQIEKREKSLHFCQYYLYKWSGEVPELKFVDGEVEAVAWISYEQLMTERENENYKFNVNVLEFIHTNY
jgi:isopentenyldiphosphate isomerase